MSILHRTVDNYIRNLRCELICEIVSNLSTMLNMLVKTVHCKFSSFAESNYTGNIFGSCSLTALLSSSENQSTQLSATSIRLASRPPQRAA